MHKHCVCCTLIDGIQLYRTNIQRELVVTYISSRSVSVPIWVGSCVSWLKLTSLKKEISLLSSFTSMHKESLCWPLYLLSIRPCNANLRRLIGTYKSLRPVSLPIWGGNRVSSLSLNFLRKVVSVLSPGKWSSLARRSWVFHSRPACQQHEAFKGADIVKLQSVQCNSYDLICKICKKHVQLQEVT